MRKARPATCHPGKPNHGRGLCTACYQNWQYHNFPEIAERKKAYSRRRRVADPARHAAAIKAWYWANREYAQKKSREWHAKHPNDSRRRHLQKLYGLTPMQYDNLLKLQQSGCAICGRPHQDSLGRRLVVDHDHSTGRLRGLLCDRCNRALGLLGDDPEILEAAIAYLANRQLRIA